VPVFLQKAVLAVGVDKKNSVWHFPSRLTVLGSKPVPNQTEKIVSIAGKFTKAESIGCQHPIMVFESNLFNCLIN